MKKMDLHIHTTCSQNRIWGPDAVSTPRQVVKTAIRKGLSGIAVTDHDTVKGGLVASKIAKKLDKDFLVIPGIEVKCKNGDIIALGLKNNPKGHMGNFTAIETVEILRDMGALVVAPHPFGWGGVGKHLDNADFDAVEGFNASQLKCVNTRAKMAAHRLGLPMVAGSDAHYHRNVGNGVTAVDCNQNNVDSILAAISKGKVKIYQEKRTKNRVIVYSFRMAAFLKTILGKPPICNEY
ncbi:MAG: PHP-associated domain-containing protein [Candidatus Jordarchaeum sp.]|uniref:PHP-associated domain-containing protein n=1 Tax=Candidatus Jordarchaeum sp. TaxID=2823881 RepID=UPI00404B8A8B